MKQIILIGFLLFSTVYVAGQVQNVDSLLNVLETKKLASKERISICLQITKQCVHNDMGKALTHALKGLNLAQKERDFTSMLTFYDCLGRIYTTRASLDTASIYWNSMLDLAIKTKNKEQEAGAYTGMANLNNQFNNSDKETTLEYYLKALSAYEETVDQEGKATILCNLAGIHRTLGNPDRAISYLEQAGTICEKINSEHILWRINYELAAIHHKKGENDKALEYTQKSLQLSRSLNNKAYEASSLDGLSLIYCANKDYKEAEKYAQEGLAIAEKQQERVRIYHSLNTISGIYREEKQYRKCEETAYRAWQIDSTMVGSAGKTIIYSIIYSNIHLGNKNKALYFLDQYKKNVEQYNDKSLHDSLSDMEVKYETEKKELLIASLKKERQFYLWLGIAGILLVFALVAILWQTKRNTRKEKQLIATRSVLDGEMRERTRLAQDLHDRLSGNLSAVKIELGGHADTLQNVRDKLDNCIRDIRDAAHGLMPTSLQSGLKVALEDFAAQFPNVKFHFFGQERRIDGRMEFVIYCCANELVNNAIKHAGATTINLQLVQDEKYTTLTVSDDGLGYDENAVTKGMGLKNIRDRVASCNGKIDISTSPGKGTETTIELKTVKK